MANILPKATTVPLASPSGTNTLKAYNQAGTAVYVTPGQYNPGISLTPPKTIAADKIAPPPQVVVNDTAPDTTKSTALVQGMAAGLQKAETDRLAAEANAAKTQTDSTQSTVDTVQARVDQIAGIEAGKGQALTDAQSAAGVPAYQQQLNGINTQINSQIADYNSTQQQFELAKQTLQSDASPFRGQGRGIPLGLVRGQEAKSLAQTQYDQATTLGEKAAGVALLQAQAQGLQGQVALAMDTAQKAVDAKYTPLEQELATKQSQLQSLYRTLDSKEKIQADALNRQYDDQKQQIADQKAQTQSVYNLMTTPEGANAGVKATDTAAQAVQKIASYVAQNPGNTKKLQVIGSHFDENGIKVESYGFVDEKTGTVTPYNASDTNGNLNLGMPTGTNFGLPTYNTLNNNAGVTRAVRNNNPGNIKASATSIKFPGVVGVESTPAADGGNFLIFDNPANGQTAIGNLLLGPGYANMTAFQAVKRYNGGGSYTAADLGLDGFQNFQSQLKDPAKLQQVVSNLSRLEGYSGGISNSESTASPTVQAWAQKVADGTRNISDVPASLKSQVNTESLKAEYQKASELKTNALTSAQALLDKFNKREGTAAVGGTNILQLQRIPGTAAFNFQVQFDNLKGLLSLDNVKYLKGQGQVSDAERRLLEQASAKLNLGQSEAEFKQALSDVVKSLSGKSIAPASNVVRMTGPQGTFDVPADQVEVFKKNGYK